MSTVSRYDRFTRQEIDRAGPQYLALFAIFAWWPHVPRRQHSARVWPLYPAI